MQVAVPGMPERAAANVVRCGHALDRREELRDAGARHADVLHPRHAQPLEGTECHPADLAQPVGLRRVGRLDHLGGAGIGAGRGGARQLIGRG